MKELFEHVIGQLSEARSKLLKKSSSIVTLNESNGDGDRKRRAEAAAMRRAKIMAQMNQMQKNFIQENKMDLEGVKSTDEDEPMEQEQAKNGIAVGPQRTAPHPFDRK